MKCAHAPWTSYNTPSIKLIQYGRRIGKKVYCCQTSKAIQPLVKQFNFKETRFGRDLSTENLLSKRVE